MPKPITPVQEPKVNENKASPDAELEGNLKRKVSVLDLDSPGAKKKSEILTGTKTVEDRDGT